jgi:hypothetical protein
VRNALTDLHETIRREFREKSFDGPLIYHRTENDRLN